MTLRGLILKNLASFSDSDVKAVKSPMEDIRDLSQLLLDENCSRICNIFFKGEGKTSLNNRRASDFNCVGIVLRNRSKWSKDFLIPLSNAIDDLRLGTNSSHLFLFSGKSHGLFSFRHKICDEKCCGVVSRS